MARLPAGRIDRCPVPRRARPGSSSPLPLPLPLLLLLLLPVLLLAGCGNARTLVPDPTQPVAPTGFRTLTLAQAGVRMSAPRNWTVSGAGPPLVVTLESGTAVVALWRYPRAAPAPAGRLGLVGARRALVAAVRRRDPSMRLLGSSLATFGDVSVIVLAALERIGGHPRRVSSTHIYLRGAELVLDEYAPPAQFPSLERTVFARLRRSLALLPAGGP